MVIAYWLRSSEISGIVISYTNENVQHLPPPHVTLWMSPRRRNEYLCSNERKLILFSDLMESGLPTLSADAGKRVLMSFTRVSL